MKRRLFYIAAILIGLAITGVLVAASIWPVINEVETGKTAEYPEIQPQFYSADPARVYDETKASIEELERFSIVETDEGAREIHATAETTVFGFVDDVYVSIQPATEFVTEVNVRSASRVGKGDFGQNARNIRELFEELDSRLGAVKFDTSKENEESAGDGAEPPS